MDTAADERQGQAPHGLAWRLAAGLTDFSARTQGAALNALAIALFAVTIAGAPLAWRRKHGGRTSFRRRP